ncbi:ATP-binding response regulator [Anaeromyxobacter diazotrophicus]|uniref:histidine kinase n=1 Tax=Anaeromyxobacter diazotrophicus TaxID=2590199 RepID=A0A7I9VPP6_9BACT|nr:ATP-binding protein [Anaeromyxobacter diazotrophicus]GEJ57937.1 hypothetical protein AMYX_26780 [Anaeromyxobacter diazotrophicus]
MGRRILEKDWSRTSLGPLASWPEPLRTAVGMCLSTRFPMYVYWGPERFQLYNDAGIPIMGARHPHAALAPVREVFPEIWPVIGPMFEEIERTGRATWSEGQLLELERHGFPEECYFTFSYSPILDGSGAVAGFYTAAMETTGQVLAHRRLRTLQALAARAASAASAEEACAGALAALAENPDDVRFSAVYLVEPQGAGALLAGSSGLAAGAGLPPRVGLERPGEDPWSELLARALRSRRPEPAAAPARATLGSSGSAGAAPALALPLAAAEGAPAFGILLVGLSPRLPLGGDYRTFLELVAGSIVTAVSSARAHQESRERADRLAALDRAKTVFFGNVSHEFRTPLTLALGVVEELLARRDLPPGAAEQLRAVDRNSRRLLRLVSSLLAFSRLEAGRAEARFEPTDLARLTAQLASSFDSACARAGLGLRVDCPALPRPVHVDLDMWEKIVLNLLSNAFKFTLSGEIEVRLRPGDGGCELTVRDTGVGIPAAELPRVFDRFYRVERSPGRSAEGSGIGLALVKELVELHGGTVAVESVPREGSTFRVRVPWGTAHLPPAQVAEPEHHPGRTASAQAYVDEVLGWIHPPPAEGAPAQPGGAPGGALALAATPEARPRVLVADDNADMRAYLSRLLGADCDVETVADGAEALDAALRRRPDVVLADVMMPRLDGLCLLSALRDHPTLRTVPVILLSARAGEEAAELAFETGADDYVMKPFSARVLLARVYANLRLSRARADVERRLVAESARLAAQAEHELTQRKRAEAQFLEAQRLEGIGRLAGGIAHDFNNILSVVLSCASFALDAVREGEPLREELLEIQRAGQRAAALTRQLLAFSRKQVLEPENLDVNLVLQEMNGMLRRIIGEDVELTLRLDPAPSVVLADRSQLEQMILNLVVNAREAMPTGGTLAISTRNVPPDAGALPPGCAGPHVLVEVADSGAGMDAGTLRHAFEPFFTTKPRGKGTGLGLATVYGIVRQSGGQVEVASAVGKGTTFRIFLPRGGEAAAPAGERPIPAGHRGSETLLVVEDDAPVRTVARKALAEAGYAVLEAASADEARALFARHGRGVALVLADVVLPHTSGTALIRELLEKNADLRVLFMSGYTDEAVVHHGVEDRSVRFVAKPFTPATLLRKVREVLDEPAARAQGR